MRRIAVFQFLVCFILLCVIFGSGSCCERRWLRYGEHCFRIYTEPDTRFMAKMKCIMEGSDLASISDESVLQYLSVQLEHFHGDRFWVGLEDDRDKEKLLKSDDTSAMDEPWAKPHIPEGTTQITSVYADCFAFNGKLIVQNTCSENLGYICGHKSPKRTTRTVCNQNVDPEHTFIAEETGNCLFRAHEKTTNAEVEELCAAHQGHFLALDDMMKVGLTVLNDHKVLANDGSKYWTGLTWNGTNIIWNDSLSHNYSVVSLNGTGSCITVEFNFTNGLGTHLYQTECDTEAYVVRSKIAASSDNSAVAWIPLNGTVMLSCPHGYNWKADNMTGYCYWETTFEYEMTWDDAERYCQSFGGHLSSFHSLEEEKMGLGLKYGVSEHFYWIGLKLDPKTETYRWSDGTPLNYTNWAPGHPDHRDRSWPCVAMEAKEKHWVSSLCSNSNWFICKAPNQTNFPSPILPTPVLFQSCSSLTEVGQDTVAYLFEGSCYFTVSKNYSWHKAKQFCEYERATLVSIHSDGQVGFLLKLLYESGLDSNPVWIGLNALESNGSFRWTDWSPVDFKYFNRDEKGNFQNQEKCYSMHSGNGLWNKESCNDELSFICKRKNDTSGTTVIPNTTDPILGNCKKGWIFHHDRCYYFGGDHEEDRVNWTEAEDICSSQDGYLTSVRDKEDQVFLSNLLESFGEDAWIGLHETVQFGWHYWVDDSDVQYTNWAAEEEPSLFDIKKECIKMVHNTTDNGMWKKEECGTKLRYICYSGKEQPNGSPGSRLQASEQPTTSLPKSGLSTRAQTKGGLPTSALVAIIVVIVIIHLLILIAAVYFHKKSTGRSFFRPFGRHRRSDRRTVYSVSSGDTEFRI